jgi:protoheme IX farnesyltransferase
MVKILPVIGDLMKYRLSLAVVFSSVTGYFLCTSAPDISLLFLITGVFLLSSGSAALNQYTERNTDFLMERTRNRPVPSGKISEKTARSFSICLLFSGGILLLALGILPLILGLVTVFFYNLVYTRLKKITILSIIPGALVGALPPLIGYSSGGGNIFNPGILAFAAFMFAWQIPHFWLIVIKYGNEYQIRHLVFFWVILTNGCLFILSFLVGILNKNSLLFLALLNVLFIILFYSLLFRKKESMEIKGAFILLNSFGFLVMLTIIAVSVLNAT